MGYRYDRDSFLSGLAVGRALWRPEDHQAGGWTCDPEYMVYFAGTDLGTSDDRHFYKSSDGRAVGVYEIHRHGWTGSNWYGPVLISPDPEAARYYVAGSSARMDIDSVEAYGMTWYACLDYHLTNARYTTGDLILYDGADDAEGYGQAAFEQAVRAVLEAAHVRVY